MAHLTAIPFITSGVPRYRRATFQLTELRRWLAGLGLMGILLVSAVQRTGWSELAALGALALLVATVVTASVELGRSASKELPDSTSFQDLGHSRAVWLTATSTLVLGAGVVVQSWFHPNTVIASGDIAPPAGVSWLSRIFAAWSWSGSDLGSPSRLQLQLPWGALLWLTHHLGGSAELAQRLWYSLLFIAAALAMMAFLATLDLGPVASVVGAFAYVVNPYVVTTVNTYGNYLAALVLLAALPALILAVSRRRVGLALSGALIGLAGPLVGYVYLNPPLVGLLLLILFVSPVLAGFLYGRTALDRGFRALAIGVPLLLAVSAYWVVPAFLSLHFSAGQQLSDLSSWNWTEVRSNITNALWLNTVWSWNFAEYFPYASAYDLPPLSLLKYVVACLAFAPFWLLGSPAWSHGTRITLKIAVSAATLALLTIFLSTGTSLPGSVLFRALYALPGGWLLREPGRFLMAAALCYAVLTAVLVKEVAMRDRSFILIPRLRSASRVGFPVAVAAVLGAVGFPVLTGSIVPDHRPILPSAHVRLPPEWSAMANFVNVSAQPGGLLVLPPDDFYQMPYKWGYYGTDTFIPNLIDRPVVLPAPQGYVATSGQLVAAVKLINERILAGDWPLVERLLKMMRTPLVLVRGDIDNSFPGRSIQSPVALTSALDRAPNLVPLREFGPLRLFSLRAEAPTGLEVGSQYAADGAAAPDLRILSVLPAGMEIANLPPSSGLTRIIEIPGLTSWHQDGQEFTWDVQEPPGWTYDLYRLDSGERLPGQTSPRDGSHNVYPVATVRDLASGSRLLHLSTLGRNALPNSDFQLGIWNQGDCYNVLGQSGGQFLGAETVDKGVPGGLRAARLRASADSSCISRDLVWRGGAVYVSLLARNITGSPPRLCLWEGGLDRCAPLADLPDTHDWASYKETVVPDRGATSLTLFLYADSQAPDTLTINEYANVQALELDALPNLAVVGTPIAGRTDAPRLLLLHTSYSPGWIGPTGSRHVLVDGLLNGWLDSGVASRVVVTYSGDRPIHASVVLSVLGAVAAVVLLGFSLVTRRRGHLGESTAHNDPLESGRGPLGS